MPYAECGQEIAWCKQVQEPETAKPCKGCNKKKQKPHADNLDWQRFNNDCATQAIVAFP
jgi:hypothetical protein